MVMSSGLYSDPLWSLFLGTQHCGQRLCGAAGAGAGPGKQSREDRVNFKCYI